MVWPITEPRIPFYKALIWHPFEKRYAITSTLYRNEKDAKAAIKDPWQFIRLQKDSLIMLFETPYELPEKLR